MSSLISNLIGELVDSTVAFERITSLAKLRLLLLVPKGVEYFLHGFSLFSVFCRCQFYFFPAYLAHHRSGEKYCSHEIFIWTFLFISLTWWRVEHSRPGRNVLQVECSWTTSRTIGRRALDEHEDRQRSKLQEAIEVVRSVISSSLDYLGPVGKFPLMRVK